MIAPWMKSGGVLARSSGATDVRTCSRRFGFETITVREETSEYDDAVAFFQQVRGEPGLRKGLLRLAL